MESRKPIQLNLSLGRQARLLIVEDDDDTRAVLTHFFSIRGYEVFKARTGAQALELAKQIPELDIILLDVFVPEVGGIEVLSQIKDIAPRVQVIIMTAAGDPEIARRAMELGAFDCFLKPLDLTDLEATVVVCLGHNEYRKQGWWNRFTADPAA